MQKGWKLSEPTIKIQNDDIIFEAFAPFRAEAFIIFKKKRRPLKKISKNC